MFQASGGLYTASFKGADMRCVHMDGQQCFNDLYKRNLQNDIGAIVDNALAGNSSGPIQLDTRKREQLLADITTELA